MRKLHFLIPEKKFLFGCKSLYVIRLFFFKVSHPAEKNKSQEREGENTAFSSTLSNCGIIHSEGAVQKRKKKQTLA